MIVKWIAMIYIFGLLLIPMDVISCDVCGCSVTGQQFGVLPQFQKDFVGLRYGHRAFKSVHPPLFSHEKEKVSYEYFNSMEIWGRLVAHERFQIFGFIPFQHISKIEASQKLTQKGLGDISLIAMYAIINQNTTSGGVMHHLQSGGGLKLPTGGNDYLTPESEWIPGIQKGTGTLDFMFNINYLLRYKSYGTSIEASLRVNGTNSDQDFRYGNRMLGSWKLFYVKDIGSYTFMPSFGIQMELAEIDRHLGDNLELSGGNSLFGTVAIDFFSSGFAMGLSCQPAFYQRVANGNLTSGTRFNAQFTVLF
ncbi:MAG: hypothetical protein IPM42_01135 [Saprospiraceae bacterium]|nr:hypothetical protein [Saprospiraceae bacterium]